MALTAVLTTCIYLSVTYDATIRGLLISYPVSIRDVVFVQALQHIAKRAMILLDACRAQVAWA